MDTIQVAVSIGDLMRECNARYKVGSVLHVNTANGWLTTAMIEAIGKRAKFHGIELPFGSPNAYKDVYESLTGVGTDKLGHIFRKNDSYDVIVLYNILQIMPFDATVRFVENAYKRTNKYLLFVNEVTQRTEPVIDPNWLETKFGRSRFMINQGGGYWFGTVLHEFLEV